MAVLLQVGELARRTGVTVRALHHYDSIGLLRPSGRSEGGYRLYSREDVARLHGIQTLRQLGVPLADMEPLLDGGTHALQAILARQIGTLDEQIARTRSLRERLGVMQLVLADGRQPEINDWLASLEMMSAYERHFSAGELRQAFERWKPHEAEWPPLVQAIRAAMDRGLPADAVEIQPLAARWIDLVTRWMEGDVPFLGRWGSMLRAQPGLPLPAGMDLPLIEFIDEAIRHRLAALSRYVSPEQQQHLAHNRPAWGELVQRGERLMADGVPPEDPAARALARDWQALKQVRELSERDELTGMPNRRSILTLLTDERARFVRGGSPFAVAILDIDHFKRVNDRYGHAMGDDVLRTFATIVSASLRSTDRIARFGGEEFLLMLPDTRDIRLATLAAERFRCAVEAHPWSSLATDLRVTCSIGVTISRSGETIAEMLERADASLYRAKAEGRNVVCAD